MPKLPRKPGEIKRALDTQSGRVGQPHHGQLSQASPIELSTLPRVTSPPAGTDRATRFEEGKLCPF
jgi:hypothetical protein